MTYTGTFGGEAVSSPTKPKSIIKVPTKSVTYDTSGVHVRNDDGFLDLNDADMTASSQIRADKEREEAWNLLVTAAGIEDLGVPTNWWPGLEQSIGVSAIAAHGGWFDPAEDHPEPWSIYGGTYTFFDPTDEKVMTQTEYVRYDPMRAAQMFSIMSGAERAEYNNLMVAAGMLDKGWKGQAEYSLEGAQAFATVLKVANYYGISAREVLDRQIALVKRSGSGSGGRGGGPVVKVEVPDYQTLLTEAEGMIRQKVGRDVKDWEMKLVADHMQTRYGQWADAKKRAMLGGNGTYEVPDPVALSQRFVADTYANEITRLDDVEDNRTTNALFMANATRGVQMAGGLGG